MLFPVDPLHLRHIRVGGFITLPGATLHLDQCARGTYQRGLLSGSQRWSGADLKGRAARYSCRYHRSRLALLRRIEARGYAVAVVYLGRYRRKEIFIFPRPALDAADSFD